MTTKKKVRGTLARLEVLEDRHAARVVKIEEQKTATLARALDLLTGEDRAAFWECMDAQEDVALWARLRVMLAHLEDMPLDLPGAEEARVWARELADLPDGVPFPLPADTFLFAGYFEAEARRGEEMARAVPLSLEAQSMSRWVTAQWRFEAAAVRVIGGQP
ncbi:hypothetical protein DEDE109153_01095 [Deinococcus deserti]|uniref:Uncharacterized protein n=1 Tax=Deinococcus deserti (strain DSM 17065 / CIP 109153 / LMG 22923 / VCD115) TaxID=546414 RepID=C1CVM3_DEIDV|nr:hypothetical protein [Deinococcus deserti]ACO46240.1 Hypothetical protein Deide_13070 [Deinococcus deserti VCD115]